MKVGKQKDSWAMRAPEVRVMLRIGRNTLYHWCELGIIPHKHVGRVILFPRKRIQEWLEKEEKENEGGK